MSPARDEQNQVFALVESALSSASPQDRPGLQELSRCLKMFGYSDQALHIIERNVRMLGY